MSMVRNTIIVGNHSSGTSGTLSEEVTQLKVLLEEKDRQLEQQQSEFKEAEHRYRGAEIGFIAGQMLHGTAGAGKKSQRTC